MELGTVSEWALRWMTLSREAPFGRAAIAYFDSLVNEDGVARACDSLEEMLGGR